MRYNFQTSLHDLFPPKNTFSCWERNWQIFPLRPVRNGNNSSFEHKKHLCGFQIPIRTSTIFRLKRVSLNSKKITTIEHEKNMVSTFGHSVDTQLAIIAPTSHLHFAKCIESSTQAIFGGISILTSYIDTYSNRCVLQFV